MKISMLLQLYKDLSFLLSDLMQIFTEKNKITLNHLIREIQKTAQMLKMGRLNQD